VGYSWFQTSLPGFPGILQWYALPTSSTTTLRYEVSAGIPPYERYYMSQTSDSALSTAALFSIEQIKAVISTPIGFVSVGTKDFPIGTGATFARNTREECIYFLAPNGPLTHSFLIFPAEPSRRGDILTGLTGFYAIPDSGLKANYYIGLITQYDSGTGELGVGLFKERAHLSKGYATVRSNLDHDFLQGLAWGKFNNGRIFLNAEYSWTDASLRRSHRDDPGSVPKQSFEGYHCFSELGFFVGPLKTTFMWAQSSGPVLTGRSDAPPDTYPNPTKVYVPLNVNYQALEPYDYLMFQGYGGGNAFARGSIHYTPMNADGTGEMGDAYAFGGRVDYAVAANLNVWGSYLWAHRLERHGFYAGQAGSVITDSKDFLDNGTGDFTPAAAQLWKSRNGFGSHANPFPDNGFLGWEMGAGINWQLLEGVTLRMRYAYWQPGPWFDQAYKAFTGSFWGVKGEGLLVERSAIHALETIVLMEL
jgi:hypothetical protein